MKAEILKELQQQLAALRPQSLRWLQHRVQNRELAEDLLQQALLKALEHLPQIQDPQRLEGWFRTLLKRVMLNHFRQNQPLIVGELPEIESDDTPQSESCDCILSLMNHLPHQDVQLLEETLIEERSVQDTAQALQITANAASVRLYRARQRLRQLLKRNCNVVSFQSCQDCQC